MAIITCSECRRPMSDTALSCPQCGKPNAKIASRSVGVLLGVGIFLMPLLFAWVVLQKGYSTKARLISFFWLAILSLAIMPRDKPAISPPTIAPIAAISPVAEPPPRMPEAVKAKAEPIENVTAIALAAAYSRNTIAADQRFKGKRYQVSGAVVSINTDFMDNPYLTLEGGINQFMEPQFKFEKSEAAKLATLAKGDTVTLVCIGSGDIMKTPMSESCVLP